MGGILGTYMYQGPLSFDSLFVEPILEGSKTETLRFNLQDLPEVGAILDAITMQGEVFAEIRITHIETLKVHEVPDRDFDGHRNYDSVEEVIERMGRYYHDTITPRSDLTLIRFEVVNEL